MEISVIICTHNPRLDYLSRVLAALKDQTFPSNKWELLLIDNASQNTLSNEIDLSWHPHNRHIREEKLGLTYARLRGIHESQANLLLFVDDDNVLAPDFLQVAFQISQDFPFIGAWGGQIRGEFEVTPPDWAKPYLPLLAIRTFEHDKWSNLLYRNETVPCGAGMCVRKFIAEKYANTVKQDPKRVGLDRQGQKLVSAGDQDLALTSCDLGLGTGQFTALKMTHLIPASRLTETYLLRLVEGIYYSDVIIDSIRGQLPEAQRETWDQRLREAYRLMRMKPRERRFYKVGQRGSLLGRQELLKVQSAPSQNPDITLHSQIS
jgi:glycosyltransferase involved in cell wall biosynthesis